MRRLAQVVGGVVVNVAVVEDDAVPEFMADWIEHEEASPGWVSVGGDLSAPVAEFSADEARAAVDAVIDALQDLLTAGISMAEQLSWPSKEEAARAFLRFAAGAGPEPFPQQLLLLEAEAEVTGETVADLCEAIVGHADRFRTVAGCIAGIRRAALLQLAEASTGAERQAVVASARAHVALALGAIQ